MERNMKKDPSPGIDRRVLLSTLAALVPLPAFLPTAARAQAPANELASWNEGPAKQSIPGFVRSTTDRANPNCAAGGAHRHFPPSNWNSGRWRSFDSYWQHG